MKYASGQRDSKGGATVVLEGDRIIVCQLEGALTESIINHSMHETKVLADEVRSTGATPLLLIDISQVRSQTSGARSAAKNLRFFGLARIAVAGGSRPLVMIGHYLAVAAGLGDSTRFFRTRPLAMQWLTQGGTAALEKRNDRSLLRIVTAILLCGFGGAALLGWLLDVPVLQGLIPSFKPMNPVVAMTVLAMAAALLSMGRRWRQQPLRRTIVSCVALWSIIFGLFAVAGYVFSVDTYLDGVLFTDKLEVGDQTGRLALGTAVSIMCFGTMFYILGVDRLRGWLQQLFFALSGIVFLIATGTIVGYSFGIESLHSPFGLAPQSLNTVLAFLVLNYALAALIRPTKEYAFSMKLILSYWQAIVVCLILILSTGVIWQQTKREVATTINGSSLEAFVKVQNVIQTRLATYIDTLHGFRGLFAASSDVAPEEFGDYFATSGLTTNYPGFSAISFAAVVPDAQKAAFILQTRARATSKYPQFASYAPFPETTQPTHYPLLYTQPVTGTTRYGFDLSSEVTRRQALEKARDTGKPVASGIINLNAARGSALPDNPGFFISLPAYTTKAAPATLVQRRAAISGFMLAYFQNNRLFGDLFKSSAQPDARYTITDVSTGRLLYSTKAREVKAGASLQHTSTITVGDKAWSLSMFIAPGFGKSEAYRRLPDAVLVSGLLLAVLGTSLVVSQLRRRDQALQLASIMTEDLHSERNKAVANQRKDEAILSSIGDAVFAVDKKECITLFNQACEAISGYSRAEVLGKPYSAVLRFTSEKDDKISDSFIKRALTGHAAAMKEHTLLTRKDGKKVAVADSAAPIRDAKGTLLGAIVVFRDISRERELDRAKTEFVSLASHQLRTPLSAINWYGEMLLNEDAGKLNEAQKQYVREIYAGNSRMIELVNALLDVSRLDLGKLNNRPKPVKMSALAESIEAELTTQITRNGTVIVKHFQKNLPPVLADPKLLRMIVQNLMSNAVKYTPEKNGMVTLTMRKTTTAENHVHMLSGASYFYFSVADSGYGIPKEQQSKIFTKLFRADNVRVLDVEGTGLGLYLVKQVVEKLGGRIWFDSTEGKGTTFYLILPFKTRAATSDTKQPGDM